MIERLKQLCIRIYSWLDDRTGVGQLLGPMMRHTVPQGSAWAYVFGSATLFCLILQVVTGIALALAYVPSANDAYASLQYITNVAMFGNFLRALHYFGASGMVLMIGLHTIRTYLMASYKYPREMNWVSGVLLLGLTMVMGFTGQLLRWDQTGVWSVIVAAEQAARVPFFGPWIAKFLIAGNTVGGATLSRFFAFHVFFVPALLFAIVALHLFLVLRHGISEPPKGGRKVDPKTYRAWYHKMLETDGVPFWPYSAWRDAVFGAGLIVTIALLAWHFGPPDLEGPPDPTNLDAYPRPDWYLLWYFAVLALLPHGTENYFMVFGPMLVGVLFLVLPFLSNKGERSPFRRPWSIAVVTMTILTIGTLWIEGVVSPWSPKFDNVALTPEIINSSDPHVIEGAKVFHVRGCENCHMISEQGGQRGPNLTQVGSRLTRDQLTLRIINGGNNMPSFAGSLKHEELEDLVTFLETRKAATAATPNPVH